MKILLLITGCCMLAGCAGAERTAANLVSGVDNTIVATGTEPVKIVTGASKSAVFLPAYQGAPEAQYTEAGEIYDSSPAAAQGVYRHDSLVYVIVVINTNREKIKYLEGTAMLRAAALLRQRYPQLSAQFRLKGRVMEEKLDDDTGIYRYALVYRLADIEKAIGKKAGE